MNNSQKYTIPADVKGLIFDLDGTLLNSMPLHWFAWQASFRRYNVELDHAEFMTLAGKPIEKIAAHFIEKFHLENKTNVKDIIDEKDRVVWDEIDKIEPIASVVSVAKSYFGKLPMSVGTGADRRRAEHMLKAAGLIEMFPVIVPAEDVANHKPAPDTFLRCAELMGVAPEHCLVFEDAISGIKAAEAANMKWIRVE
ncbi:MAG: HAD-IA family hydrolase [Bacteroidia bacterium]|nr:HAD-IA family hydrolase [Bacteroidia bacterium]